jgi:hypothetical protein
VGTLKTIFENRAWRGIRLDADTGRTEGLVHLEVSTHRTSRTGDFYIRKEFDKVEGKRKVSYMDMEIFRTFDEVIKRVGELVGENNISEFKNAAEAEQREMLQNKYVRAWKGMKP